jgi:hypothetical protein
MELIRKIESHVIFIPGGQFLFDGNVCSPAVKQNGVDFLGIGLEETIEDDEGERIWNI